VSKRNKKQPVFEDWIKYFQKQGKSNLLKRGLKNVLVNNSPKDEISTMCLWKSMWKSGKNISIYIII